MVAFRNLSSGDRHMNLRMRERDWIDHRGAVPRHGQPDPRSGTEASQSCIEQLRETLSERPQTVAGQPGLPPEQRTKIREAHAALADNSRPCGLGDAGCFSRSSKQFVVC